MPLSAARRASIGGRRSRNKLTVLDQLGKLDPEEKASLGENILGGVSSGLKWIGESLAKPQRVLYALPAGKPRELLNLIPFSDTMGITTPKEMTSGKEMLQRLGLMDKDASGFLPGLGGFAFEVLTDPLLPVTGPWSAVKGGVKAAQGAARVKAGILTAKEIAEASAKGGKSAVQALKRQAFYKGAANEKTIDKVLGITPYRMAQEIEEGQRGLIGVRLPFADKPLAVLGTGKFAANVFRRTYDNPISAAFRHLLSHNPFVKGARRITQKASDIGWTLSEEARVHSMNHAMRLYQMMDDELGDIWQTSLKNLMELDPRLAERMLGDPKNIPTGTEMKDVSDLLRGLAEHRTRQTILFKRGGAKVHPMTEALEAQEKRFAKQGIYAPAPFAQAESFFGKEAGEVEPTLRNILKGYGLTDDRIDRVMTFGPEVLRNTVKENLKTFGAAQDVIQRAAIFDDVIKSMENIVNLNHELVKDRGGVAENLVDAFIDYFPRRATWRNDHWWKMFQRKIALTDIKGGSLTINRMTMDPVLIKKLHPTSAAIRRIQVWARIRYIEKNYGVDSAEPFFTTRPVEVEPGVIQQRGPVVNIAPKRGIEDTMHPEIAAQYQQKIGDVADRLADQQKQVDRLGALTTRAWQKTTRQTKYQKQQAARAWTLEGQLVDAKDRLAATKAQADILGQAYISPARKHTVDLVEALSELPEDLPKYGGLFTNNILEDLIDYTGSYARWAGSLEAVHQLLARSASPDVIGPTLEEAIDIHSVGKDVGQAIQKKVKDRLVFQPEPAKEYLLKTLRQVQQKLPDVEPLKNLKVPEEFHQVAQRYVRYHTDREASEGLARLADNMLSMFKGSVTIPFPAFHSRNFISGLWQNAVTAMNNPAQAVRAYKRAIAALRGQDNELMNTMIAGQVTRGQAADEILGSGAVPGTFGKTPLRENILSETINPFGAVRAAARRTKESYLEGTKGQRLGSLTALVDPDNPQRQISGVLGGLGRVISGERRGAVKIGGLGSWGRDMNSVIEFVNRAAHVAARLEDGWSPAMAARSAIMSHFDYSNLSSFEKQYMRRLVPFFSFSRFNLPHQLRNLIDKPAHGGTAMTVRAINTGRPQDVFMPQHLGEGAAIRISGPPEQRSALIESGLFPVSEAFNKFAFGAGGLDVKRTGENLLAMFNPLVTAPLEGITGRSFAQHRPASQLFKEPFSDPVMNFWLYHSPAARVGSTRRMLADPRKSPMEKLFNVLVGGARAVTWNEVESKRYELLGNLQNILEGKQGVGQFVRLYAKDIDKMTPSAKQELALYLQTAQEIQQINKRKKKAGTKTVPAMKP